MKAVNSNRFGGLVALLVVSLDLSGLKIPIVLASGFADEFVIGNSLESLRSLRDVLNSSEVIAEFEARTECYVASKIYTTVPGHRENTFQHHFGFSPPERHGRRATFLSVEMQTSDGENFRVSHTRTRSGMKGEKDTVALADLDSFHVLRLALLDPDLFRTLEEWIARRDSSITSVQIQEPEKSTDQSTDNLQRELQLSFGMKNDDTKSWRVLYNTSGSSATFEEL